MPKVKITGLPKAKEGMEVLTGVNRSEANVELEKGEIVLSSDPSTNQKITAEVGGELHSNGGTPENLAPGTAVYSDTLKLSDPSLLKILGFNGKTPKTFAEIARKWETASLIEKRDNPLNDKITNTGLDRSLENANFKLSLAFALQQFHHKKKGSQQEHSKHFEPLLERTGLSYDQLFNAMSEGNLSDKPAEPIMDMGGQIGFNPIPKAQDGLELPPYDERMAFSDQGIKWLNTYLTDYGIGQLGSNASRQDILDATIAAQRKAVEENPDLVFDFMTTGTDKQKSHRPNNELQAVMDKLGSKYDKPKEGGWTNEDLKKMLKAGDLSADDVLNAYKDNKWWYRMVTDRIKNVSQDEYNKLKPLLKEQGVTQNGVTYLYKGNGVYEAYKVDDNGNVSPVEPDPKVVDELYKWNVKHIPDGQEAPEDMSFRWENRRALSQARKNKRNLPYLRPLTAVSDTFYTDQAYYNPDQAIAAIQSASSTQGLQRGMFAGPQQQLANQMGSNTFQQIAQVVGSYADKNVDAYNRERLVNTQIAQRASDKLASAIEGHHNKVTTLKQNFANAYAQADNQIAEQEIAMHRERANRKNMEKVIGDQYRIDPNTGLHVFVQGKDFAPDTTQTKTVDDRFAEIKNAHPGISDDAAVKLAMAEFSGKYNVQAINPPINEQQFS